jgi:two-component system sensor histidine kinase DesK
MHWPKMPTGADKPSWGGLFGAVPLLYIFWDPYQKNAATIEWLWTGAAFVIFLGLVALGCVYWSRKRVMQAVSAAMTILGITFLAYRPSGAFFLIFVAAFAALAAGGSIFGSAAIIAGTLVLIVVESSLLWPFSWMPYIVAIQALLIGAAMTVVARQQTALRQTLKTAERERIARDLHDILGHTLSVIILKSELASRLLEHDAGRAKQEIEEVERISRRGLAEIREAIAGYRAGDLRAELDNARSTLETAGIRVEQRLDPIEMPVALERVLALVLREAVTNVLRHARATRCRLTLQRLEHSYRMQIRDDGQGGTQQEGMGIRGIRERIAAIGGSVSWACGAGTELDVTIPVHTAVGEIR